MKSFLTKNYKKQTASSSSSLSLSLSLYPSKQLSTATTIGTHIKPFQPLKPSLFSHRIIPNSTINFNNTYNNNIHDQLLRRNNQKDLIKIDKIINILQLKEKNNRFNINPLELTKLLYVQKLNSYITIRNNDSKKITLKNLLNLGGSILNLQILKFYLNLYGEGTNMYQNTNNNMNNMNNSFKLKNLQNSILKFTLSLNNNSTGNNVNLLGISNLNQPENKIPKRIRIKFDSNCLLIILGYLEMAMPTTKGRDILHPFIIERFIKPYIKHKYRI
ncbi:uncharacterized protein NDAI_0D04340 [Naumovozyma dairenensis CBS 421]|uniref:Uncharacterized protein n=1 Tax=Naumovozyma dairenensis (strain ATCC 10597 / BCRC 20456 / CBS 421 / NBRC 0211 / NRRL Y-12639) TaxID=1071378 RepID=G0WAD7_NAUDC|nr:hypothetical protein NDAI_0D04340 [Naumovozyma dairenensis CBS 421]CCD24748.1 hypothetical protein NDAI_0D04340 [Naumovozyma dairenensis CBS 421]